MSGLLRNKHGCWTCRVRRKKCDGARPHCSTCKSLSITCYGYGLKPDWVDRGEKEKTMIDSFKQVVKRTSRKKATVNAPRDTIQLPRIAPKSSNGSFSSSPTPPDQNSSADERLNTLQGGLLFEQPPKDHQDHLILFPISAQESFSLMHYLDNVFPLQYPMYKANVLHGGRGWLLGPMFRIKPLYHATLAISSYHCRKLVSHHHPCQVNVLVEQEKHLQICLAEFRQMLIEANTSLENLVCPSHGLGIMALVVQLIFLEFFTAQGNEWKIHLRAATNMQQRYFRDNLIDYGLSKGAGAILRGERTFSMDNGPPVMQEIMIYKFFTGVIIWLDIISSITAGSAPHLLSHHFRDIPATSPWIKLEEIMGCQNQVMLQIGRIAALYEHKNQILRKGNIVNTSIEETAREISREIESCLAQTAFESFSFSDGRNTCPAPNPMVSMNSHTLVTHMFALMASIYLHLVIYGFQELDLLESSTHRAMETLGTQVPAHLLSAMVCPLYVIGSVAGQEEERVFFRKLFSSPPLLDPLFENRTKVLPALEEIWRRREIRNDLTWEDSLELVTDLLLL